MPEGLHSTPVAFGGGQVGAARRIAAWLGLPSSVPLPVLSTGDVALAPLRVDAAPCPPTQMGSSRTLTTQPTWPTCQQALLCQQPANKLYYAEPSLRRND